MDVRQLRALLPRAAFSFRGYNVTNLGKSAALLAHPRYGAAVEQHLRDVSAIASDFLGRRVDLVSRVRCEQETDLASYGDAVALILAMEVAHLSILRDQFDFDFARGQFAFGYSLGEIAALVAAGTLSAEDALRVPLSVVADCVDLARESTLAVVFCRGCELSFDELHRHCLNVNQEGRGVIGVSTILSPNSLLVIGQGDTVDRLRERLQSVVDRRVHVRKNEHKWPPLHTPIMWERAIPNRAARLMHALQGTTPAPRPPVFSLVTGKLNYAPHTLRDVLHRWVDHPQRLWDAVYFTLTQGVELVVHVGPEPNLVPATFQRISDNVQQLTDAHLGWRAVSGLAARPWLKAILPARTALFRAPLVRHIALEDWLLEQTA